MINCHIRFGVIQTLYFKPCRIYKYLSIAINSTLYTEAIVVVNIVPEMC